MSIDLIYVSQGNIPSRYAHTFNAMKMAEAFSSVTPSFQMVVQAHWKHIVARFNYEKWYGIIKPFDIHRLFSYRSDGHPFFNKVRYQHFDKLAYKYLLRTNPKVVFTRSEPLSLMLAETGPKFIVETHVDKDHWAFEKVISISSSPFFLGLVTIHPNLEDQWIDAGFPKEKILTLPDAVNPDVYSSLPRKELVRDYLKLSSDKPLIMYSGHLYEYKGVDYLFEAAKKLPQYNFCFVGGWEEDVRKYKALSKKRGNIEFRGFQPNELVPLYLTAADVLVLPNTSYTNQAIYTSPLKLFEYWASGVPVVATDIPAFKGIVRDQENALLVSPNSASTLSEGINKLVNDRQLSDKLVANGTILSRKFTWKKRAQAICDFYI